MLLKDKIEIEKWLNQYNISNYELIKDFEYGYVVDVNDDVYLNSCDLKNIKVKFNVINGDFHCYGNKLKTLEGCPKIIKGEFNCGFNKLINLEYAPLIVNGGFNCVNNYINNLDNCFITVYGDFLINNNKLKNLICMNKLKLHKSIYVRFNNLENLDGCPKIVKGLFDCSANKINNLNYYPDVIKGYFNLKDNKIVLDELLKLKNIKFSGILLRSKLLEDLKVFDYVVDNQEFFKIINILNQKKELTNKLDENNFFQNNKLHKI